MKNVLLPLLVFILFGCKKESPPDINNDEYASFWVNFNGKEVNIRSKMSRPELSIISISKRLITNEYVYLLRASERSDFIAAFTLPGNNLMQNYTLNIKSLLSKDNVILQTSNANGILYDENNDYIKVNFTTLNNKKATGTFEARLTSVDNVNSGPYSTVVAINGNFENVPILE